ncbi:MAG: hypothetical protein WBE11_07680 [Candidatus Aminicenantaceae bacterium]
MDIFETLPLLGKIIDFLNNVLQYLTAGRLRIPRKTIKLIPKEGQNRWSQGKTKGQPAFHLVSDWYITNIWTEDVVICKVNIRRPKTVGDIIVRHPHKDIYGSYPILQHHPTEAQASFWVRSPAFKKDGSIKVKIDFVDQFGNTHRVRRVKFLPYPKKEEEKPPQLEAVSEIANPVEKEVAAVLQAELSRYKACGRRVGGLGSIKTTYRDKSLTGVGPWFMSSNSPDQQDVVTYPENAKIESDNASTLINYYASLNDKQQNDFVKSCLDRLSREKPYASIGYFILFVLYRIGHLEIALERAKRDLQGDTAYGFSDLLLLLNGLLRFEHPNFSKEMLDDSEQFLSGIKEHTFRIPERIATIRSIKLAESVKGTDEEKKS